MRRGAPCGRPSSGGNGLYLPGIALVGVRPLSIFPVLPLVGVHPMLYCGEYKRNYNIRMIQYSKMPITFLSGNTPQEQEAPEWQTSS